MVRVHPGGPTDRRCDASETERTMKGDHGTPMDEYVGFFLGLAQAVEVYRMLGDQLAALGVRLRQQEQGASS